MELLSIGLSFIWIAFGLYATAVLFTVFVCWMEEAWENAWRAFGIETLLFLPFVLVGIVLFSVGYSQLP